MANRYHPFSGWVPCKLHRTCSNYLEGWYSTVLSVLPHVGRPKTPCFERRIFCGHPWAVFFAPKDHWQHIGLKLLNSCNFPGSHFLSFCWLFGCEIPSSLVLFLGEDDLIGPQEPVSTPLFLQRKKVFCFFSFDSKLGLPHTGKNMKNLDLAHMSGNRNPLILWVSILWWESRSHHCFS